MAFNTSTSEFDKIFSSQETEVEYEKEFMKKLANYLDKHKKRTGYAELSAWIHAGRSTSHFKFRDDLLFDLGMTMEEFHVPFVFVASADGRLGVIFRTDDKHEVSKVKDAVKQKAKSKSHMRMTCEDLNLAIMQQSLDDKTIVSIPDLTETEVAVLEDKANDILAGSAIGIGETEDRDYVVMFHGKSIMMRKKKGRKGIMQAVLETMLAANGPNQKYVREKAKISMEIRRMAAAKFVLDENLDRTPLWVVGENRQYLKVTNDEIEYGHSSVDGTTIPLHTFSKMDEKIDTYIASYMNRMGQKNFTFDTEVARMHFVEPDFKTDILSFEGRGAAIAFSETLLAKQLDTMIENKIQNHPVMQEEKDWGQKLMVYEKEAVKILSAAARGKIPDGYEKDDMRAIKNIAKSAKLNLSAYVPALEKLLQMKAIDHAPEVVRQSIGLLLSNIAPNLDEKDRSAKDIMKDQIDFMLA